MPGSAPGAAEERARFPPVFLKTSFKQSPGLWRRRGRAGRPELTSPCNAGSHTGLSRPGGGSGTSQRPGMGRWGEGGSRLEGPAKRSLLCGPTRSKLTPISKIIDG